MNISFEPNTFNTINTSDSSDHSKTDVTELQLIRDHANFVTALCANCAAGRIYSAGAGGALLSHVFPLGAVHYSMAADVGQEDEDEDPGCTEIRGQSVAAFRAGNKVLARSSSSFQVSTNVL